ncbi:ubiquinone biosynthesis protein UbiE [Sulfitobacter sp. SK012]|uniref:class I SAM-dependent methyltransferase n=1 Tax=Sulfitobacter sp. SK012 TaxID=1389005 RepID=UPI000E0B1B08|nr:class I SAM-dependent methyltransferase [Sulfitobacter sp. SK012]AXI46621.1 ubiquinone biosynthesis protein UbiE [Sulfitobacter sp. SK012]
MNDNADQAEFWGDVAGREWVQHADVMDTLLAPVLDAVLTRADLEEGHQVLDIGCGTGISALAAADLVGKTGHVLGADISPRMLELARTRAAGKSQIDFIAADVSTHNFNAGQFDRVISRFGVMFFDDSSAAFSNVAKAMKPGAQLSMGCWGQIWGNPYFTMPAGIAKDVLGPVPKTDPDAPGPFAFRDPERVESILHAASLTNIRTDTQSLHLPMPGDAQTMAHLYCSIGPAERALVHHGADAAARAELEKALTEALLPFEASGFPAEIHFYTADAR